MSTVFGPLSPSSQADAPLHSPSIPCLLLSVSPLLVLTAISSIHQNHLLLVVLCVELKLHMTSPFHINMSLVLSLSVLLKYIVDTTWVWLPLHRTQSHDKLSCPLDLKIFPPHLLKCSLSIKWRGCVVDVDSGAGYLTKATFWPVWVFVAASSVAKWNLLVDIRISIWNVVRNHAVPVKWW